MRTWHCVWAKVAGKKAKALTEGLMRVFFIVASFLLFGCNPSRSGAVDQEGYGTHSDGYGVRQGAFYGYSCTGNCSGHRAGYNWAMRHGIVDPADCGGRSNSFIEGCWAYAEQQ